jgi:hypothetical protein
MSADNCIYIQKRGKRWYVWMGLNMDDPNPKPYKTRDVYFPTLEEAWAYARGWLRGEDIVEYGIIPLEDKK